MKKPVAILIVLLSIASVKAQNLQVHYDFGENRKLVTSTVEMFKPDKWGSTFFFIDMNYDAKNAKTVSLAYWEIARAFKLGKSKLSAHVEYNGGLFQFDATPHNGAFSINNAWLGGLEYGINNAGFTKGISLQVLYKYIKDKNDASFQLTTVWYMHMLNKKLTFNGFADFWREDNDFGTLEKPNVKKFVFLTEPQLWYNVTENLSFGSEVEMSVNFSGNEGFMINPTLAGKWKF
ncbi:MAG: DUF5020 family protein [Bacteroidales bacterium]|nr:DUF5020 family protein [Bacteroidales bacterium]